MLTNKMKDRKFHIEGIITKRAGDRFGGPIGKDQFQAYRQVWLACAQELRAEFDAEGLTTSAHYVQRQIDDEEQRLARDAREAVLKPYWDAAYAELQETGRFGGEKMDIYHQKKKELELS